MKQNVKANVRKGEISMAQYIRFDWAMKRLLRDKANFIMSCIVVCKYKEIYWQITNVRSFFVKEADVHNNKKKGTSKQMYLSF